MTFFVRNGNSYMVKDNNDLDIHTLLPVGNYTVKQTPQEILYFEQIDSFQPIKKVYGNAIAQADRILNTFHDRTASTGVLLAGEKGSGKTLLAKTLSLRAAELGIPTIVISAAWRGESFNKLIQDVEQPAIVLFDEFEKVYDREEQQEMLTLLDGVYPTKKMFILTCNDKYRVDEHLRNRPGRIFYALDFKGLDVDFITDYCNDVLNDKSHIDTICKVSLMFSEFNFDMLKALVEDMNRYNESPQQALAMLNAKPSTDKGGIFDVELVKDGVIVDVNILEDATIHSNPLSSEQIIIRENIDDDLPYVCNVFVSSDLVKVDVQGGRFIFTNKDGATVTFTRRKFKEADYYGLF